MRRDQWLRIAPPLAAALRGRAAQHEFDDREQSLCHL
jgi:hypothetical protein